MPGRRFSAGTGYRYGFNGKENDNDVKGEGNQQDYGMRVYDPRVARFLSVDPLTNKYPYLTSYQFASNSPTKCIDIDGLEGDPVRDFEDWVGGIWDDVTSADKWVDGMRSFNQHFNPVYQGANHISKIATKQDLEGNKYYGTRLNAAAEAGADVMAWITFGRVGKIATEVYTSPWELEMNNAKNIKPSTNSETPTNKQATAANGGNTNPAKTSTATVFRTQGGQVPNASQQRVNVSNNGQVSISGDDMLYVTIDDKAHQVYFYNKRGGSENGASIVSFEIPESLANQIKKDAVPQAQGKLYPNKPQMSDPTKSKSAYGLPKPYIDMLRKQIVQGSGQVQTPTTNSTQSTGGNNIQTTGTTNFQATHQ